MYSRGKAVSQSLPQPPPPFFLNTYWNFSLFSWSTFWMRGVSVFASGAVGGRNAEFFSTTHWPHWKLQLERTFIRTVCYLEF